MVIGRPMASTRNAHPASVLAVFEQSDRTFATVSADAPRRRRDQTECVDPLREKYPD
jgi:hypothetical protein